MRSLRQGRAIHLLDIENLAGCARPSTAEVEHVMDAYRRLVLIGPMDQFMVGVNHNALVGVGLAFHGVQLLMRSGPDGADSALSEAALADRVDLRFERVVIGSGDGYFADLARWLADHGVQVFVVARPRSLSWRLYAAAGDFAYLDPAAGQAA
ncbi:hypothetical protein GCM10023194_80520 [Planotetraspora phitsanulokensis]|uniref:NYN domain-containing protein n=1 Tax=Planotetraspora phitsanulokensis TaxID=575192 RepID=A0A8J3UA71_9ACTN|nr:NYN domain-containing protein [Planotetraspora phitsanulokensis]GII41619.1 hypothetical protein Pph01_66220 [Planotetraspora phitsanulokensis]